MASAVTPVTGVSFSNMFARILAGANWQISRLDTLVVAELQFSSSSRSPLVKLKLKDGVQPGVAGDLRKLVDLSQDRNPSHPDAAGVRPCLLDRVTPTALRERCRSHKELCLEVMAVGMIAKAL